MTEYIIVKIHIMHPKARRIRDNLLTAIIQHQSSSCSEGFIRAQKEPAEKLSVGILIAIKLIIKYLRDQTAIQRMMCRHNISLRSLSGHCRLILHRAQPNRRDMEAFPFAICLCIYGV